MSLMEQTPPRSGSRFGKLSSNMFFTRNTAKPKRVRHIEGLNGALICSVNDDPSVVRSSSTSAIGFNRTNALSFEAPRRAERLLPPMGFWNTYGVIRDTDRWRHELATLASASGLGIEKDDLRATQRPNTNADPHASRSGAHYSMRTGRFNEGTPKSRGRTGSRHGTDTLFSMPENEREMWMLQVLCQLLGTSNLEDVQSWLVSATVTEKEQARAMINSALEGLKESERTGHQHEQPVDFTSLSNFVEKQKLEEKQTSQKFMQEALRRPSSVSQSYEGEQKPDPSLQQSWGNLLNNNYSDNPTQNTTTYKRSFQNQVRRSYSSFDTGNSLDKLDESEEYADPIEPIEHGRSSSLTKVKKTPLKPATPLHRSSSSYQPRHPTESIQFNDDEQPDVIPEDQRETKNVLPPIKTKDDVDVDENVKSRKIRQLQTRLSRQEEEAKRQLSELQSKQSRLENALKLLTKQNSPSKKSSHEPENDHHPGDTRLSKSNAGVWKPEPSILHRLQAN